MTAQKIWVSRWALSKGIFEVAAQLSHNGKMATYSEENWTVYVHGNDFQLTEAEAREVANTKVAKKIAAIEKQLVKLKKLTF
ncbi:hypothetical protein HOT57_gp81 [Pseudomonas phage phCDa]|uniref:Uncharacterized protein n=1 Tax=Pseudomonas phage phCDa TaxID=2268587 RepID=A0A2Z5H8Y3_9CAUD|nr:hypothetical protein HOT57_gp81 [Pseudomonas phage phCDa]AXC36525.1 hypothetical protein phCDa_81 [Pseudomonas phage phCDa]